MCQFAVCVALLLLTGDVAAEQVTLARALTLANAQHPLLRAGAAQVDVAEAGIVTASAYPNPQTAFVAGKQLQPPGNPRNVVPLYVFEQPLELGPLRPARTPHVFSGAAPDRGEPDRCRKPEARTGPPQPIQVRVEVGEVGRLELVRAEAEVASAQTLSSSAQLQQVTAVAQFRAAVGGGLEPTLEFEGQLAQQVSLPPIEEIRRQATENHPALSLARSEIRRAEARVAYESALKRPQLALRGEIDMTGPAYRFGFGMPVPLWNQRQGPIAEAAAGLRQASAAAEARQIEILEALEGAYERYAVAGQQLRLFEQGLLREAEAALRAAEVAYQLGERGILEVLDAQRLLRTVRLNFLNAQFDRQAAHIDLDELRGIDLRSTAPGPTPHACSPSRSHSRR